MLNYIDYKKHGIYKIEVLNLSKFANFIVKKHMAILIFMIGICITCAMLIPQVEINTDMSKYLPDDSSMKQGVDIMASDFSITTASQTIRVMFEGLTESEIPVIREQLESIQYVDSVSYVADSEDYNKDGYTKFIVNTSFTYGSPEEVLIEKTIESQFANYKMNYMNDNVSTMELPWLVIGIALVILFAILFIMSSSWFEPILFMVTIGIAVAINMGTNIILGSVSQITMSIAAILQLVLSMDYSIILANRYRQEKTLCDDKQEAMKKAWLNAFSSVTSSGMTTVIGLTMLVFMSFKIGMDLGLVLAKGVLLSMVCVLTVLPALLLIFDEKIEDTEKKELHIKMDKVSGFQYKMRKPIAIFFVLLFIISAVLQSTTKTVYSISAEDPIAEVFAPSNQIVMIYNNQDEENLSKVVESLENSVSVKNIQSYSTTLGKEYTSSGMMGMVDDMGVAVAIDPSIIDFVYYCCFNGENTSSLTISQFVNFLSNNIINNETFSSFMGADVKSSMSQLENFTNKDSLTKDLTINEIAETFNMQSNQVKQLMVLYFSEKGGVNFGTMTLPVFADFIVNDVSKNETYASMFDEETLSQMEMLKTFTNKEAITEKRLLDSMSEVLGVDIEAMKFLYSYHKVYTQNAEFKYEDVLTEYLTTQIIGSSHKMSVYELVNFIVEHKNDFGSMVSASDIQKLEQGQKIINGTMSGTAYTPNQMADIMDMDAKQMKQLYLLYTTTYGDTSGWKISIQKFISFISSEVLGNAAYASQFDANTAAQLKSIKDIINASVSDKAYSSSELATLFGSLSSEIDNSTMELLCLYYSSTVNGNPEWTLTIEELFDFIANDLINDPRFAPILNENIKKQILGIKSQLDAGINQMLGENYSLMLIETSLPVESEHTTTFMKELTSVCDKNLQNDYYFVGNTPMSYEMEQSFDSEMLLITLLTAISIFIVVAITFRSLSIPLILVLLVQGGVYVTMTVNGLLGYSIYYLALLIVQCILMGATIDYAILFTNYYRENRKTMDIKESITAAYKGSIHTILTSGLIMIVVTGAIGISPIDPTIAQICQTVSIGALSATLLILFVLPGLVAALDRFTNKQKKDKKGIEIVSVTEVTHQEQITPEAVENTIETKEETE